VFSSLQLSLPLLLLSSGSGKKQALLHLICAAFMTMYVVCVVFKQQTTMDGWRNVKTMIINSMTDDYVTNFNFFVIIFRRLLWALQQQ